MGAFSYALEQGIKSMQAFSPTWKGMIDFILANKKEFDYAGAMGNIITRDRFRRIVVI